MVEKTFKLDKSWESKSGNTRDPQIYYTGASDFQQKAIKILEKQKKLIESLHSFIGKSFTLETINESINKIKNLKSQ